MPLRAQASKLTTLLLKNLKTPKTRASSTHTTAFLSLQKNFQRLPVELIHKIWTELVPILIAQSGRAMALKEGYMKEYHLLVLASEGTGKSNFVMQYVYGFFWGEYDPTVSRSFQRIQVLEDSYSKYDLISNHWCILDILDSGGCELEWRHDHLLKGRDCILLLFSLTSRDSFTTNLPQWVKTITRLRGIAPNTTLPPAGDDASPCPVVLVGTKSDDTENRCVSREEAEAFAAKLNVGYVECSAKSGEGVKEAVYQAVQRMLEYDKENGWRVARKNANSQGAQKKRSRWMSALLG